MNRSQKVTIDLVTNLWPWPLVIVAVSDNTWPQLIYHHQTFWVQSDLSVSWSIVPSRSVCSSQICVPTRTQPCCVNKLINSLTKLMSHLFPGHGAVPVILNIALHTRHAHKFLSLMIPSSFVLNKVLILLTPARRILPPPPSTESFIRTCHEAGHRQENLFKAKILNGLAEFSYQ